MIHILLVSQAIPVCMCVRTCVQMKQYNGSVHFSSVTHAFVIFTLLVISFRTPVSLTCKLKEHLNYAHWRTSQHAVHLKLSLQNLFLLIPL